MIESLPEDQIAQVVELGEWRDNGHLLAVGRDGEVFTYSADKGENHVATEQREGAARRQGPTGRQGAAGSCGAAAPPEPAREDGITDVRARYLNAMPEIREYYPDLHVIEVEDGIWVVTRIFPIGRDGPSFWICLFLHDDKGMDAKAFAFNGDGRRAKPTAIRHTNFPDGSVCAFCADDDVWTPGESPHVLLNLYAEWLVCQLFLNLQKFWPGRQYGPTATYRELEFLPKEWCFCDRGARYGSCHMARDREAVRRLRGVGKYEMLPDRVVPAAVVAFARSGWKSAPTGADLFPHKFRKSDEAEREVQHRIVQDAIDSNFPDSPAQTRSNTSLRSRLLSGTAR